MDHSSPTKWHEHQPQVCWKERKIEQWKNPISHLQTDKSTKSHQWGRTPQAGKSQQPTKQLPNHARENTANKGKLSASAFELRGQTGLTQAGEKVGAALGALGREAAIQSSILHPPPRARHAPQTLSSPMHRLRILIRLLESSTNAKHHIICWHCQKPLAFSSPELVAWNWFTDASSNAVGLHHSFGEPPLKREPDIIITRDRVKQG